jgi:hypothetical protein
MYYRVAWYQSAFQVHPPPSWRWKSTVLSSLAAVLGFLRLHRALPQDRLRVFSSSSREGLEEQLVQENLGLGSPSVTAAHFLHERPIHSPEGRQTMPACEEGAEQMASITVATYPSVNESSGEGISLGGRGMSSLESRRLELELGPGGDHDVPYRFVLPAQMPLVLAWMRLLARIRRGEWQA